MPLPTAIATLLGAVGDGLLLHALLDPDLDIRAAIKALRALLAPRSDRHARRGRDRVPGPPATPLTTPCQVRPRATGEREREALVGVARGPSNSELAAELSIGEATVKSHSATC